MRILIALLIFPLTCSAQFHFTNSTTLSLFRQLVQDSSAPTLQLNISDNYCSKQSNIQHTYIVQSINSIEIPETASSIHLHADQSVVQLNNNTLGFIPSIPSKVPGISATQAIQAASKQLHYQSTVAPSIIKQPTNTNQQQILSDQTISSIDIPAKLVYHLQNQQLTLAWEISIQEPSGDNWWYLTIDATSGKILKKHNWVKHCRIQRKLATTNKHCEANHQLTSNQTLNKTNGYRVYDHTITNPDDGTRSLVINPDSTLASPYGWHDTNGIQGPEYFITRGNNVHAYEDGTNPGYSPNGGTSLQFDFPLNLLLDPNDYEDAAVTNLFYTANIAHDILYHHGFDEASGNFQEKNYSGQGLGGDFIRTRSQIHSWCNAAFVAPPDGMIGTLRNFVCNGKDGSYSNEMVFHEYAHGLTSRLTGGPSNANCLGNWEQMGEGWSDFFALLVAIKPGDQAQDPKYFGDWFFNDQHGIRNFPYTTDLSINPLTYNDIKTYSGAHDLGEVWCVMLWELTWKLIDQYGWSPNLHTGNGGNNIALKLIIEALKLQPCEPGFVDARDAILVADMALYGGSNHCLIWEAFARRGLGKCADQGDPNNTQDGFQNFAVPQSCGGPFGCDTTIIATTDLPDFSMLSIASNPFHHQLVITLSTNGPAQQGTLNINSMLGQSVYNKPLNWSGETMVTINLSLLPDGLYVVSYQNDTGIIAKRVLKSSY